MSLHLHKRAIYGTNWEADLTYHAWPTWTRTIRALGGYWMGDFTIQGTMSRTMLREFYTRNIGKRIVEKTYGRVSWEGEIIEMTLNIDGSSDRISLDTDSWHNRVKVQHTYPRTVDVNQGNMTYDPGGNSGTFQDDGQDFSDWETAAPGSAAYYLRCFNDDPGETGADGYIGAASTTTNANDTIDVYHDEGLTNQGWNGATSGKTCESYVIESVTRAGVSEATDWAETTDSSDQYGESQYIDVRGEMLTAAAEGIRDRRLAEHAYPRSVPTGGLASDASSGQRNASLDVVVAGYVYSMNRRYFESDVIDATASTQIETLVDGTSDAAEFVTAGIIDTNSGVSPSIMCSEMPMRLWDLCEEICEMGDGSGARWIAGVYAGRVLNYEAAETEVRFYWRNGRLVNQGGIPVYPTLIKPNILVQRDAPFGVTPPSGNAWDNPRQFYVEEVEFIAPRSYRLIPYEGEAMYGEY